MASQLEHPSPPFEPNSGPAEASNGARPAAANQAPDLHEAAHRGDGWTVQYLLATGADPGRVSPEGWRPLHVAAAAGHEGVVRLLLDAGARPDRASRQARHLGGAAPLHVAVAARHAGVVRLLLDAGADPDPRDDAGFTPLHVAASLGDAAIVKQLVLAGADADAIVAESSPLELALRGGHRATAALLRQIVRSRRC